MTIGCTDFNLHNIVHIRVLDGTARDVAVVRRQLGPIEAAQPLAGEPDITIRFVDQLPAGSLRYLGVDDAAFNDEAFLVLRSKHKTPARVQIPLQQVGGRCEILCERGLPAVPLLIPIVNLTALARGALPLHAAAFLYEGCGVLATGWSKGGKTESLLSFMDHGATYVGDEWVYIDAAGRQMAGIPEPVRLWEWHFQEAPHWRQRLTTLERLRLAALRPVVGSTRWAAGGNGRVARLARRTMPLLQHQQGLNVSPQRLFGAERCQATAPLDKLFFVVSHESADVTVVPVDGREVAQRMLFSLQEEYQPFLSYYWKFRFAFPGRANELIDCLQQVQAQALLRALTGKEAYAVYHPYPAPIQRMFTAMLPYVGAAGKPEGL